MINRHGDLTLSEKDAQQRLKRLTRRGFLAGGVAAAAGYGAYHWLTDAGQSDEIPWPQKSVLDFNGKLSQGFLSDSRMVPTFSPSRIGKLKANGNEGLDLKNPDGLNAWKLTFDPGAEIRPVDLSLGDVQTLPRVEMITNVCCIEGWNTISHWTGVRFSDFLRKYTPASRSLPAYVYMATPDAEYYVGLDMKSALHPQTLLAWDLNSMPLAPEHGAPLRLVIPVKYGIKSIKKVGSIRLTDKRPADYWAENGYDWFAGL